MAFYAPLALLLATSTVNQVMKNLFDDSFTGIYKMNAFDWAMLVPYFTVLIILSMYGLHRYETMRTYLKHRKKLTDIPPVRFDELPACHNSAPAL